MYLVLNSSVVANGSLVNLANLSSNKYNLNGYNGSVAINLENDRNLGYKIKSVTSDLVIDWHHDVTVEDVQLRQHKFLVLSIGNPNSLIIENTQNNIIELRRARPSNMPILDLVI